MPIETRKSSRDKTSVENLELSTGLSSNICNSGQQEGESGQQVSASTIDNERVEDGGILTSSMAVIEERETSTGSQTLCSCSNEIKNLKDEIQELRGIISKLSARNQPCEEKDAMQITSRLERNNDALIEAVQALSRQIKTQTVAEDHDPLVSPTVDLAKDAENQTLQANPTAGARKKKTKRKNNNRKPQESNATDQSIVEIPEYTTTSVTGNDSPSVNPSQPSAAGQSTKKKVTVIAGDSIVKNVIGSRMGAKDSTNHFVVKPFPGANLSDMEDFVKPLVRKMPDKLILHVGTNDIKSSSPKAIAESTFNLVTQIRQDSPGTSVGVSALLVRSDNSDFAVKVNQVNTILKGLCSRNRIPFLGNSNIDRSHLNSMGLHLNKKGSLVLENNLAEFARSFSA